MQAVYKCRLCGEVFTDGTSRSRKAARTCMVYLHAGVVGIEPTAPAMTTTHTCNLDDLGLADFQGWKKEPTMYMGEKEESGLLEDD